MKMGTEVYIRVVQDKRFLKTLIHIRLITSFYLIFLTYYHL